MIIIVGDLVTDVLVVHDGPIQAGSDTAAAITVTGGGQAANTAAWLAYTGAPVTLVAAVGDDAAGRDRVAELTSSGVRCAVRAYPGVPTGSIVVLASADERTMLTDRGAAVRLDPADVTAAVRDAADAVHLHLSGYVLLDARSRPGGLAALAAARERGLTTSVDAASAAPLRQVGDFADQVRGTDLLLCNADEADVLAGPGPAADQAAVLAGLDSRGGPTPAAGAERAAQRAAGSGHAAEHAARSERAAEQDARSGRAAEHAARSERALPRAAWARVARNVVVKQGGDGAVWAGPAGVVTVAGERVAVTDPTGAGDAFAAGLLRAWCAGATPAGALAEGAALGAAAVTRVGARP